MSLAPTSPTPFRRFFPVRLHLVALDQSSDAIRLTTQVQADLASGSARQKMGLAWHFSGPPVIWHNGQTAGCHSFVALDLANHRAVVMLANAGDTGLDTLGAQLFQLLNGQTPTPPAAVVAVAPEHLRTSDEPTALPRVSDERRALRAPIPGRSLHWFCTKTATRRRRRFGNYPKVLRMLAFERRRRGRALSL